MKIYEDVLYPLKKILGGESPQEFGREYWERHANSKPHAERMFDVYKRAEVERHVALIEPFLPKKPLVVLDLGCGLARGLVHYREILGPRFGQGIGVDLSEKILERARAEHPEYRFFQTDLVADSRPLEEIVGTRVDLLLCHGVLTSVPRSVLGSVLGKFAAALREDGLAVLSWWAPYYVEDLWIVRFVPNSHRHRTETVESAMKEFFEIQDVRDRSSGGPTDQGGPLRKVFHAMAAPFHPREHGFLAGRPRWRKPL